jgi:antitoxin component YwqK of YwqJK toxin-antitoxin module
MAKKTVKRTKAKAAVKTRVKAKSKLKTKAVKTDSCSCGSGCSCGGSDDRAVFHGLYASVDPETGVFVEANYSKGTLQGEYTEYYDMEAEIIKTRGRYEGGKKEGQWISYGKDGKACSVESYRQGRKIK